MGCWGLLGFFFDTSSCGSFLHSLRLAQVRKCISKHALCIKKMYLQYIYPKNDPDKFRYLNIPAPCFASIKTYFLEKPRNLAGARWWGPDFPWVLTRRGARGPSWQGVTACLIAVLGSRTSHQEDWTRKFDDAR